MKTILNLIFGLLLPAALLGQYQIKVTSRGASDSIIYIRGTLFDDKNFIPKDTIKLNGKQVTIKVAKPIIGGVYFFYFPNTKERIYFILENKDSLQFKFSGTHYLDSATTNKSKNKTLLAYQRLEKTFSNLDSLYAKELAAGKKYNLAQKASFFKVKTDALVDFRTAALKSLKPNDALYIYFDGLNKLDLSVPSRRDYAGRDRFIKQFDINKPKFLFTPIFRNMLTDYFSYIPLQADSISKGVDTIMKQLNCSAKSYSYVFDYITKLLKNREIQNNTEAYTGFIQKYVQKKPCAVINKKIVDQLVQEAATIKSLKLLDTCANVILPDTAGVVQNLHAFASQYDYTVLIFFDPSCEHCKVELPKMDSVIKGITTKTHLNIGKFAVCNDGITSNTIWKDFILDNKLNENYMHVKLDSYNMELRKKYDAFTNPLFYLINKNSTLIGKKISPNTLQRFIFK